jgi:hypothetical protein
MKELALITAIVVGKKRGAPGEAIPIDLSQIDSERECVYKENWFDVYPPTADELGASLARHK